MKNILALAFVLLAASGCATTLKPTEVNKETGLFDTSFKITAGGTKVREEFKEEYRKLAFVKTDEKSEQYNNFFYTSIKNINKFEEVKNKEAMEQLVFKEQLTDKVSSVSDKIGLHNLQKHIGNFIIIEPYVEWKGGYQFYSSLKVTDAQTGEVVLHLENSAFNWSGLDQPLFFPLLNGLVQWVEGKPIPEEESKQVKK